MRGALQSRTGDDKVDNRCARPCAACPFAYVDRLLTNNERDSERRERLTESGGIAVGLRPWQKSLCSP